MIASLYFFQEKGAVIRKYFSRNVLREKCLFSVTYFLTKNEENVDSLRHKKLWNSLTLIFKSPTSHVLQLTLILAQFSTSGPYNCWPLYLRLSVYLWYYFQVMKQLSALCRQFAEELSIGKVKFNANEFATRFMHKITNGRGQKGKIRTKDWIRCGHWIIFFLGFLFLYTYKYPLNGNLFSDFLKFSTTIATRSWRNLEFFHKFIEYM